MEQVKFIMLGILMGFFIIAMFNPCDMDQGPYGDQFHNNTLDSSQPIDEKLGGGVKSYKDPGDITYNPSEDGPGGN